MGGHIHQLPLSRYGLATIQKWIALGIFVLLALAWIGSDAAAVVSWKSDDDLFARSCGASELHTVLEQEIRVPHGDEVFGKSARSLVAALDARSLEVSFSASLSIVENGHTYTNGLEVWNKLEFEERRDLVVSGYQSMEYNPLDPEDPIVCWGSRVLLSDLEGIGLVDPGDLSMDLPSVQSDLNVSINSSDMIDVDALVRSMQAEMDRLEDEGIDGLYEIGCSMPHSDSAGGVTCNWGEREVVRFDL